MAIANVLVTAIVPAESPELRPIATRKLLAKMPVSSRNSGDQRDESDGQRRSDKQAAPSAEYVRHVGVHRAGPDVTPGERDDGEPDAGGGERDDQGAQPASVSGCQHDQERNRGQGHCRCLPRECKRGDLSGPEMAGLECNGFVMLRRVPRFECHRAT